MGKRILLVSLLVLALAWLASCGSKNAGVEGFPALNEASHASSGVSLGGFEVIRHNEAGNPDPTLNSTLSLRMEDSALVISVDDSERTEAVTLDVSYDAAELCPQRAEFHGLLGDGTQVLSLSVLDHAERIALGEAAIGGYVPAALKGDFATLHYTAGPARNVSAMGNFAHSNPAGVAEVIREIPNLVGVSDTDAETATVTWTAGWHVADGDSNSEVNAADIVPIAQKFGASTGTDWSSVVTDYDRNTETGAPDLQPIALYYTNKTVEYLVEASDDADGAARTTVATLNFVTDQQAPTTPATAGDLMSIYPWYQVDFNAGSTTTFADLAALDVDANQMVRVWITPRYPTGDTTDGVVSSVDLEVAPPVPPKDNITVTALTVTITGTDNGAGGTNYGDTGGTAGTVMANGTVDMQLESISGTFNALPFDAATFPDDSGGEDPMTQADYDLVFGAVRDALTWDVAHTGDANARRTVDWLVPDTGAFPITGDPGSGTIFPDDDPESVAPGSPEGSVTVSIAAGTYVPGDTERNITVSAGDGTLDYTIGMDVLVDPVAAEIPIYGTTGFPVTTLTYGENNVLIMELAWGSGGEPADLATTSLQMHKVVGNTVENSGSYPVDFTYVIADPATGEFTIREDPEAGLVVLCNIPGLLVQSNSSYAFRINNGEVWSSINKPEGLLTTEAPPPPQKLLTVPETGSSNNDEIVVMYEDPVIRRNSDVVFDVIGGSVDPWNPDAYNDILKINGDEFNLGLTLVDMGGPEPIPELWPKVGLQNVSEPSSDGSEVTAWAGFVVNEDLWPGMTPDPEVINACEINLRQKDRITLDVAVITPPTDPGDPTMYYVYKLFNSDGSVLGWGNFTVAPMSITEPMPSPDAWAVNAWDREEAEYAASLFTGKTTMSGSTINTLEPDVLWFMWSGGYYDQAIQDPTSVNPANQNVRILATDNTTTATMEMELGVKIVGVGTLNSVIAIHTPTTQAFANPSQAGWPGIFRPGRTYTLELRDPHFPGAIPGGTYANVLVVTGTNPNL